MPLTPGTRVGPYEIVAPLGAGGMGEVYRARDSRLDRDVAVKILQPAFGSDRDYVSRFEREAKTLAALNHPHIAHVYGLEKGLAEGGAHHFALIMELVEGPTLAERLARGPMALDECVAVAQQVAEALEAAHEAGVIHRDIKPANIKIRGDGTVKVLDFGLAKAAPDGRHADIVNSPTFTTPAMTAAGIILGTAAYMAPEQARGRQVDKRADIWAFGCVVYEMLTGRPPFGGDTITDVIAAVVKTDPDWNALPPAPRLRALVIRCLQKDPRQRLRDIGDARLELADPLVATQPAASVSTPRRGRGWLAGAAILVLAVGVATGIIWQSTRTSSSASPQWTGTHLGGPAITLNPRISPDGQLVAFVTVVDNLTQVAVMKPDSGNWSVLTRERTNGLTFTVSWASDGSRIYYDRLTDSPRGIYSVPALGGDERLVIENAAGPLPLADGSLVFLRINNDRQPQLHRLWPANGRLDALPAVLPVAEAESQLRPLPGGRSIAFIGRPLAGEDRSPGLYQMDLETQQIRPFGAALPVAPTVGAKPWLAIDPADGSAIVSVREGSLRRLYRIDRERKIRAEPLLMFPQNVAHDVGHDGALYVCLDERPVSVLRLDTTNGSVDRIAHGPSVIGLGVAPLPDGRVLIPSRAGNRWRILVVSPGKEPTPLVDTDEDTRPPMTAVGDQHAALIIGSNDKNDIAVVVASTGRIIERFPAPPRVNSLAASPDGKTLYVAAGGSISAIPRGSRQPRSIGAGDSMTVDPQSGDIIAKLDEQDRFRLVRIPAAGGAAQPIPFNGEFRMIQMPLMPGAIRDNQMTLPLSTADSWDWHAGVVDLRSGKVERLVPDYATDFHHVTRAPDGTPVAIGLGFQTTLWKFTTVRAEN